VVNPINMSDPKINVMAFDTLNGQKTDRSNENIPPKVVDKKENVGSAREEIPREEVEKAAEKLNRLMGLFEKRMEFKIHEKSHKVMVKIIDMENGEVVQEIPPQKVLDMLSSFSDFVGILVDHKV
jgi:flagellar protein FlaG